MSFLLPRKSSCRTSASRPPGRPWRVMSGVPPKVGLFPIKVSTRNMQTGVEMAAGPSFNVTGGGKAMAGIFADDGR